MPTNEDAALAAMRVLRAYEAGQTPHPNDLWAIQLSVSARDAADLLLPPEDLARKIIRRGISRREVEFVSSDNTVTIPAK